MKADQLHVLGAEGIKIPLLQKQLNTAQAGLSQPNLTADQIKFSQLLIKGLRDEIRSQKTEVLDLKKKINKGGY